jgi:cell division protein ZapA
MSEMSIKVTIAGRIYPITVKPDEEEKVRDAAKRVDDNLKSLQSNYAVKDKQDLLAMTALQFASKSLDEEKPRKVSFETADLDRIEKIIDGML